MIRVPLPIPTAVLALGALAPATLAQNVWRVDDNGGADFVNIQDAIDASLPGDVIEVEDGAYPAFTVDGMSLVIRGLPGQAVTVATGVLIKNLIEGEQVELESLGIGETFLLNGRTLRVQGLGGTVRLLNCRIVAADWNTGFCPYTTGRIPYGPYCQPFQPYPAFAVQDAQVVALESSFHGAGGGDHAYYYTGHPGSGFQIGPYPGGHAVTLGSLHTPVSVMQDSEFMGGEGGTNCFMGEPGGVGVWSWSGSATLHGSTLVGGSSSVYWYDTYLAHEYACSGYAPPVPAPQSDSLLVTGDTSVVTHRDTAFDGPIVGFAAESSVLPYCFGWYSHCPCGNAGLGTAGCENSFDTGGVLLTATGTPSVSNDTVTLWATGLNPNAAPTGLFFQGTQRENGGYGTPLNDGLLCASGTIIRLKGKAAVNGEMAFGFDVPGALVSVRGAIPAPGGTRTYQLWYRNQSPSFCMPERFNMSNGVEVVWGP